MFTVVLAFAANLLVALAKSAAALITGSASMLAEAAHSWADTGNEVFLIVAEKRGGKEADDAHPLGYGKEAYVWSMFAAFGLLSAGAAVSILHGVTELGAEEPLGDYAINYIVLAVAFVLEGISFSQAVRSTRHKARAWDLHPLSFINRTSDPTLRAVFVEDSTALLGLLIAAGGIALDQLTGQPVWDALGSIAVGLLLAVAAVFLVTRNREFLIGVGISGPRWQQALQELLDIDEVYTVSYLHLEYVGPGRLYMVASVDLHGDDAEDELAERLEKVEDQLRTNEAIQEVVLSLSASDEPALQPGLQPARQVKQA